MDFSNKIIFYLLIFLFLVGANLTAQNLRVCSVEFPDTVTIGETVTLKGYVLNTDNIAYTKNIKVHIDIEDVAPDGILNDGEINDSISINQNNLAPNDSVYFEKDLLINPQEFGAAGVDLVVAWPQVSGNDGVINDDADIQLTYVQEETETDINREAYDFLPEAIKDYIELNYPGESIAHVCTVQTHFKIELDNGEDLIFSIEGILKSVEEEYHNNYDDDDDHSGHSDDDDDGDHSDDDDGGSHSDDDDDDGDHSDDGGSDSDDDDDDGDHSDDDDESHDGYDDWHGNGFWNREMETSPFKIIISKQTIQVFISDSDLKIEAVDLYELNGSFLQRLSNQSASATLSLSIQNSNCRIGVLQIYLKDYEGSIMEFNKKIILGL